MRNLAEKASFGQDRSRSVLLLRRLISVAVSAALLIAPLPRQAWAQDSTSTASTSSTASEDYSPQQLDALLAPIALYPDPLLTQVLMASAYPLEVVSAARWVQEPDHSSLSGTALENALASKDWDPSVKSLVPFPQVLVMMNNKLDWLQQLGYAMSVQQGDVMDAVQRLRHQAQLAGQLQSTAQQVVSTEGQSIIIQPAQPTVVYVPVYDPTVVYGTWAYPAYPPVYLPPPPAYYVGPAVVAGIYFGAAVAITAGLWGWASPHWGGYGNNNVYVNVNNYNKINVNRPPINNPNWRPPPPNNGPGGGNRPPPGGPIGRPNQPPPPPGGPGGGKPPPGGPGGGKPPGTGGKPPRGGPPPPPGGPIGKPSGGGFGKPTGGQPGQPSWSSGGSMSRPGGPPSMGQGTNRPYGGLGINKPSGDLRPGLGGGQRPSFGGGGLRNN